MQFDFTSIDEELSNLPEGKVLLVVPPFSLVDLPCIGLDILQTIASSEGIETHVLYANMLFAKYIGIERYNYISRVLLSMHTLLGERIFAQAANSLLPKLGKNFLGRLDENFDERFKNVFSIKEIRDIADLAEKWSDMLATEIVNKKYELVGITTGHQQTNAAISVINKLKNKNPKIICFIGGSACDGEMADGIITLCDNIDYVFSGESENSWRRFLRDYKNGTQPLDRIIRGEFLEDLDSLDVNDNTYSAYFNQLDSLSLNSNISILYESSRGCWWGEHNKCTFCGVNGWNKHYRYKSEEKVLKDLATILRNHPNVKHIQMVDTLMPRHYFKRLVPELKRNFPQVEFFYEQRADLSLAQVMALRLSGIKYTQVGIEALSTDLLGLLNKGITTAQNLRFLRYAKSVGLLIGWNLLTDIPNDKKEHWEQVIMLMPNIFHLNPPLLIRPIEIARFSPYYEHPEKYGISELTVNEVYREVFPEVSDIDKLAWVFNAKFTSASKEDANLKLRINHIASEWIGSWKNGHGSAPVLRITKENGDFYLEDTRFEKREKERISIREAEVALFGVNKNTDMHCIAWGIERKILVLVDGEYVPLATAHPSIFKELSHE